MLMKYIALNIRQNLMHHSLYCSLFRKSPGGSLGGNSIGSPMYGEMTENSFDELITSLMDYFDPTKWRMRYVKINYF